MRKLLRNSHIRDNVLFIMIAIAIYLAVPTLAPAEVLDEDFLPFTESLPLSRGRLAEGSPESFYLTHKKTCEFVVSEFGWSKADCPELENIIGNYRAGVDSVIIEKPNSQGYVKLDDWDEGDRDEQIKSLWDELVESSKAQSKEVGETIQPVRWVVYPTLNKRKQTLVYAFLIQWGDAQVINIKATLFDRKGYVVFRIVPDREDLTQDQMLAMVDTVLDSYHPSAGANYAEFSSGDKIAAVGAVGVLAGLLGVKYGKAAGLGLIAVVLAVAKKAWFLIFMPFVWIFRKMRKSK
jgi:uncharacterized membrane-anchored protein